MTRAPRPPAVPIGRSSWRVWGTTATLAVQPSAALLSAARLLHEEIERIDAACNRFDPASDLSRLSRSGGQPVAVGAACMEALLAAVDAAERTGGAVDPTIGTALCALGYDRDFDEVVAASAGQEPLSATPMTGPVAGWGTLVLDRVAGTAAVPAGVTVDLGATAKALCADRAAARIARELRCSVLVGLGGDLSAAGTAVEGGWQVALVDDARDVIEPPHPSRDVVTLWRGGLATSGTTARAWRRGGVALHHILDPSTGLPAPCVWRSVTVAARSCLEANVASTAAIVWGDDAPFRIAQWGLAARFVPADGGEPVGVGGWPEDHGHAATWVGRVAG